MLTPEILELGKWLGGIAVTVFAWMLQRSINRIDSDIGGKADKEHLSREIGRLEMQLQETREARERDIERLERVNSEKFTEFSDSMRDRINSLERNIEQKFDMLLRAVNNRS